MQDEDLRQHGEAAADFAKDIAGRTQSLDDHLDPAGELEALRRAVWLIEREFGADVVVQSADEATDDLVKKAAPGRPAIDIDA
jgi:leucyl-tRNA synthetase